MIYPVNEYFTTIQGEAKFTGTPSLFIRLQGCDVGCPWCDTKHTWKKDNLIPTVENKTEESDSYAEYNELELLDIARCSGVRHVVITGGEPAMYDLNSLTSYLLGAGFTVQVETSGTYKLSCNQLTWVTLSPKLNMPGGKQVLQSVVDRANEIKFPVGKFADILKAEKYLHPSCPVWLQPLSQNPKATQMCVDAAIKKGFKLSLQTHKYIGAR